ncbi:MAG TPA: serine hydrolase [Bacteroidia bacterium]|jgi:CubicO group peptidase (beta-lactamase class C family)|nr:serine hydrolase [Bacteroidia bacterium]
MIRKIFKFIFYFVLTLIVLVNLIILCSGRLYIYKAIRTTYFVGHTGPSATEYQIFENRKIEAANPAPLIKSKLYNSAKIPSEIEKILNKFDAHAFVIIKNDSLLHEQYWDGFSDTSHTNSFSVAKTYCSILLGCAYKDSYIKNLDQPVGDFIPEFKIGDKAKVTLRNLTTMTSGIDFDESYISPFAYPAEGYYGDDLLKASLHYDMNETPGQIFRYVSGNSALLGICISKAVGKTLSQYLSERLWKDLECQQPAWWSLDKKDGQEKGFCCINSNATDFARIGMLYLNYGKWKGKQIVDSDYVANSIVPFNCKEEDGTPNKTYGYNWWLTEHAGNKIFYARGILGQYVICVPSKKLVLVKLGRMRRPKTKNNECPEDVAMCLDAALQMYP